MGERKATVSIKLLSMPFDRHIDEDAEDCIYEEEELDKYSDDCESNCHCDTYGVCGGISCRNYWTCNGK